jgi:hypothetical protein
MCKRTIAMGNRKRIGSLFCLRTNRTRNRMAIRTQIRTRVDGPLDKFITNVCGEPLFSMTRQQSFSFGAFAQKVYPTCTETVWVPLETTAAAAAAAGDKSRWWPSASSSMDIGIGCFAAAAGNKKPSVTLGGWAARPARKVY